MWLTHFLKQTNKLGQILVNENKANAESQDGPWKHERMAKVIVFKEVAHAIDIFTINDAEEVESDKKA